MGLTHAILEVTHFRRHLLNLIMVEKGFEEVIRERRTVRGDSLGDGNLGEAMNRAGI